MELLREKFPGRLSFRLDGDNSPLRSYDLTALESYLWDNVKDRAFANKRLTLEHLKTNIHIYIYCQGSNFISKNFDIHTYVHIL